jgi:hypothetical protein
MIKRQNWDAIVEFQMCLQISFISEVLISRRDKLAASHNYSLVVAKPHRLPFSIKPRYMEDPMDVVSLSQFS